MKLYEQPKVQKLIDATFEIAMRIHAGELAGKSREQIAEWVASNLAELGFPTRPAGLLWGVIIPEERQSDKPPKGRIVIVESGRPE